MTLDLDAIKARLERGDATCAKCGAPRSHHPYRHPFQPSHDDGLATFVPALVAEVERLRSWQEAAFDAHPNLDLDIEGTPDD